MKLPYYARTLHFVKSSGGLARKQVLLLLLAVESIVPAMIWAQQSSETVVVDKGTLQLMQQRIDQLEARVVQLEEDKAGSEHVVTATSTTPANYAVPPLRLTSSLTCQTARKPIRSIQRGWTSARPCSTFAGLLILVFMEEARKGRLPHLDWES